MPVGAAYYNLKEYWRLIEICKRLRAKTHDAEDLTVLCEAMERRLANEEREREAVRNYQRRRRLKQRQA